MTGYEAEELGLSELLEEIYPRADSRARAGGGTPAAARAILADYVRTRAPDCVLALVYGSAVSGDAAPWADIDALLVRPDLAAVARRRVVHDGRYLDLVETGADRLDRLLANARTSGNDWIVTALAAGEPVVDAWPGAAALRAAAAALLAAGPDPASTKELEVLRAAVTSQVADLCRCPPGPRMLAAGLGLFAPLATLLLKQHGAWSHRGKHFADRLDRVDPELNRRLRGAYADLLADRPLTLALFARDVLAPCGGWLMDGFANVTPLPPQIPAERS